MFKFFVSILIVFTVWAATCWGLSAERRPPTQTENQTYLPIVQLWLGGHWEKVKDLGDDIQIVQRISEVNYCCVEDDEGKVIHIVDIKFHAKYFDRGRLVEEKDMAQRILFVCVDGRITDWDPLPAYKLEEVA